MRVREEILLALGVVGLAILIAVGAFAVPAPPPHVKVGPAVLPLAVAAVMLVLGACLLAVSWREGWVPQSVRDEWVSYAQLGWVGLGLAANVALIERAGFTIACTAMFVCVARGFGSRRPVRDFVIGATLCVVSYIGFDYGLGIRIGAGPFFGGII